MTGSTNSAASTQSAVVIHAELRDAIVLPLADGFILTGHIWNDSREVFEDDMKIRTTFVEKQVLPGVYKTRNTLYKVSFAETMKATKVMEDFNKMFGGLS